MAVKKTAKKVIKPVAKSSAKAAPAKKVALAKKAAPAKKAVVAKKTVKPAAKVVKSAKPVAKPVAKAAKKVVKAPVKATKKAVVAKAPLKTSKPAKPVAKPVKAVATKAPAKKAAPVAKKAAPVAKKAAPAAKKAPVVVAKKAPVAKAAPAKAAPTKAVQAPAKKPAATPVATPDKASKAAKPVAAPAKPAAPVAAPAPAAAKPAPKKGGRKGSAASLIEVVRPPSPILNRERPVGKKIVAKLPVEKALPKSSSVKTVKYEIDKETKRPILPAGYKPSVDEEYMNALHIEYFRQKLLDRRASLVAESKQTIESLKEEVRDVGDDAERASRETENALELRERDRNRKMIGKLDSILRRIDTGDYGYCVDTGEEIGLERLEARPEAERTLDAQGRREHLQRQFSD